MKIIVINEALAFLSPPIPYSSVWGKGSAPSCVLSATNNHSLNRGSPCWGEWAGAVDSLHTMSWQGHRVLPLTLVGGTAIPGNSEGEGQTRGVGASPENRVGGQGERDKPGSWCCLRSSLEVRGI